MNQKANPTARKSATWIGVAVVGVALVGAASYYFDIPPRGDNLTGTVTPAQRYRAEQQVGAQDVKLADQSVAQALQSDVVVKLIRDPSFQTLAAKPEALQALAVHANAFATMASQPAAFAAMAAHASVFQALAAHRQAMAAIQASPAFFASVAANREAFQALAATPAAMQALANANAY